MARNRVNKGRFTAKIEGDFVVFIIGMRFNKPWKVHKWWTFFTAMPKMLSELSRHPDKGLLGARSVVGGRTISVIQYWRSFEDLEAFARNTDDVHFPVWRRFNAKVGANGDVGIYHETFKVSSGAYECVYANMPVIGLAAAGEHISVSAARDRARDRIAA